MVERWNGMPQVLPAARLLAIRAGKNPSIQAGSSRAAALTSSNGTIASASIRVYMSAANSTAMSGGVPALWPVSDLANASW